LLSDAITINSTTPGDLSQLPAVILKGLRALRIMRSKGVADSIASLKKWGIPPPKSANSGGGPMSPEMALLERLVWVKFHKFWWPALLYHSYSELQEQLYKEMDMVLKAQFAMAILNNNKEQRRTKVAKLLGRPGLEVVEVDSKGYCDFYWKLPNVLPDACKKDHYGNSLELYFDFHRALDEVEEIIEEVSQKNFALMPGSDSYSWLERAHIAVKGDGDSASVGGGKLVRQKSTKRRGGEGGGSTIPRSGFEVCTPSKTAV
jgi:hypothetical protein